MVNPIPLLRLPLVKPTSSRFRGWRVFSLDVELLVDQAPAYMQTLTQLTGDRAFEADNDKPSGASGFDVVSFMDSFGYYTTSQQHPDARQTDRFLYVLTNTHYPSAQTASSPGPRQAPSPVEAMRFHSDRQPLEAFLKQALADGQVTYIRHEPLN
ncbi:MAG: hypothetical protein R2857_09545 [Vampirovibrionales bacterium]